MAEQDAADAVGKVDRDGRVVTFYSYKGGTGRTMAVANVAWIIASNGYRVLAVDWDLEAPGLSTFFAPFLGGVKEAAVTGVIDLIADYRRLAMEPSERTPRWVEQAARVRTHAIPLDWDGFRNGGSIDLLTAGQLNADYSATLGSIDWEDFYTRLQGGRFFAALRADMCRSYDYILIDSRTGLSDSAEICTVDMPHELVVCFTLGNQSIDGAASVARLIDSVYGDRGIRILPVPMRVDSGELRKVAEGKAYARSRFAGLPQGLTGEAADRYWTAVEVPYKPFYAFEEILAPFGDEPGHPTTLLSAFERLTAELTGGRVTALDPVGTEVRRRYAEAFHRWSVLPQPYASDVQLSYVPEDRPWSDWIEHVLTRAGFRVRSTDVSMESDDEQEPVTEPGARTVAVLSSSYMRSLRARTQWQSVTGTDPQGLRRQLIPVRIGEVHASEPFNNRNAVDLTRADEAEAVSLLLGALGAAEAAEGLTESPGPRYPGTRPRIWNVRNRNSAFTGRAEILERLREQFGSGASVSSEPQVLLGLGGVGKTQVAMEYACRFMADYDLVWWIDAEFPDRVAVSLAELATRLGLQVGNKVAEAAVVAREALRLGRPVARWLLIFDNAGSPEEVARFFPTDAGHILVTSRNQAWSGEAEPSEVDVFDREESIEHLRRRSPGISRDDADRVAEAVGDLPLAVSLAKAWLDTTGTPVDDYVARLHSEAVHTLSALPGDDYPLVFGRAWEISLERLAAESPGAVRLLETAAYFSPDAISKELLYGDQLIRTLEHAEPNLRGRQLLRQAIEAIGRYGLAKVDLASNTFQVHRMVQAMIRSRLTDQQQIAARHVVHGVLVGARPPVDDADDPAVWPAFERIWPHLAPSRALECHDPGTRDLLLDRVRYLWKRGELRAAETLAARLDQAWGASLGEHDRQILFLHAQLANVLRDQGRLEEALKLDRETLEKQRALQGGGDDLHSLMTARGLAADLRALGRFRDALALDLDTVAKMQAAEDDPQTWSTLNNLAIDYRFTGDYLSALKVDEVNMDQRVNRLGPRHPYALTTKAALAEDLRALGDYRGSVRLLEEFRREYGAVPVRDLWSLRYAKSLAVALRQSGSVPEARAITEETYAGLVEGYGALAPDTLACALNLAADYAAAGEGERALDMACSVRDGYRESLGLEHPFTLACSVNITVYLCDSGRPVEAVALGRETLVALKRVVGPDHPYALIARLNLANAFGALGDLPASEALGRATLAEISERYGPRHPDAVVCASNLAVTLHEQRGGRGEDEAQLLRARAMEELIDLLGATHEAARACRRWRRLGRSLEVLPT